METGNAATEILFDGGGGQVFWGINCVILGMRPAENVGWNQMSKQENV